jgi:hypothetical protein
MGKFEYLTHQLDCLLLGLNSEPRHNFSFEERTERNLCELIEIVKELISEVDAVVPA